MASVPYPAGQAVVLGPWTVKDPYTQIPTAPASFTITVKRPDGTTTSPSPVNDATGVYHAVYTPDGGPGHYGVRAVAATPANAFEDQFDVLPSLLDTDAGQIFGWADAYLTIPEFKAMPTGVDVDDLIRTGSAAANDSELANVLRRATRWCENHVRVPLRAHQVLSEHQQARTGPDGRIHLAPRKISGAIPLVRLTRFAYGTPTNLTVITNPGTWVQDGSFVVDLAPAGITSWAGALQFGSPLPGTRMYVEYDYIAGWPVTTLTSAATAAASSLPLADVTGIQPGDQLSIADPGAEELVTVAASWTPATGPATIPLAAATAFAHAAGAGISELPPDIKEAVCQVAIMYIRASTDSPGAPGGGPEMEDHFGVDLAAYADAARAILDRYVRDGTD